MKRKSDFILIAGILVIAAVLAIFLYFNKKEGAKVAVMVGGKDLAVYDLSEDRVEKIQTEYGMNVLVIEDGIAKVTVADCPDGICTQETPIQYDMQSIICLPHNLVIEIRGGEDAEVDAVVQ